MQLREGLKSQKVLSLGVTAAEVMSIPALSASACAALRRAIDENQTMDADSVDGLPDHQFSMCVPSLDHIVGPYARVLLFRLAAVFARDVQGRHVEADSKFKCLEIFGRRYSGDSGSRPWLPFHMDTAVLTVNVSLTNEEDHAPGGSLLAAIDGKMVHVPRREGEATIHGSQLLHGVSRCESPAPRYSLILFFN